MPSDEPIALGLIAVGQVERVDEHVEPQRRAGQAELLLHAQVDQVDVGDAAIAGVRFHVDLRRRREAEAADADLRAHRARPVWCCTLTDAMMPHGNW